MENKALDHSTVCKETNRAHLEITLRCNNNCVFCLQGHHPDESHRLFEDIKKEINELAKGNVEKIIISGGEPTIHPYFIQIIQYAKKQGFSFIQVISNGRLFSIPSFTEKAIAAGLSEITLSIHGHTPELHDSLVNAPGALQQIERATKYLRDKGIIISVDTGIFQQNYRYLKEIVEFVHEKLHLTGDIDLIGPTLQGNAEKNIVNVMPSYEDVEPFLARALQYCKDHHKVCWVLRVPLKYMTGYEVYKQDNEKLVEQSLSMKSSLTSFPAFCKGDKCQYCRMIYVCEKLEQTVPFLDSKKIDVVLDDAIEHNVHISDVYIRDISTVNLLKDMTYEHLYFDGNFLSKAELMSASTQLSEHSLAQSTLIIPMVDFNTKTASLFDLHPSEQLLLFDVPSMRKKVRIIITKQNIVSLPYLVRKIVSYKPDEIEFTSFGSYGLLQREVSWETGMSIHDGENIVPNLFRIEKKLSESLKEIPSSITTTIKNIPYCIFTSEFFNENVSLFKPDDFFSLFPASSLKEKFDFAQYVELIYKDIYKERIKACDACPHRTNCAGFDAMYLKLLSLRK